MIEYFLFTCSTVPSRGPFLESPGNFSGPKSKIQIEIQRIRARILACKLLHFVSLTVSFLVLAQNCWNLYLSCKPKQLYGPVNYRDFRETSPSTDPKRLCYWPARENNSLRQKLLLSVYEKTGRTKYPGRTEYTEVDRVYRDRFHQLHID